MTKDKYIYELIDKCMMVSCQDNILVENFELSDDLKFYESTVKQFISCVKFYDEMRALVTRGEIDETTMELELKMLIALIRQKALYNMYSHFQVFLEKTCIVNKDEQLEILRSELQNKTVNVDFLMNKLIYLRNLEQEDCMKHNL